MPRKPLSVKQKRLKHLTVALTAHEHLKLQLHVSRLSYRTTLSSWVRDQLLRILQKEIENAR